MSGKHQSQKSKRAKARGERKGSGSGILKQFLCIFAMCVLLVGLSFFVYKNATMLPDDTESPASAPPETELGSAAPTPSVSIQQTSGTDLSAEPTEEPYVLPEFEPYNVDSTLPSNLIQYTDIMVDGNIVESYSNPDPIDFGLGEDYTDVEGIVTFRGNNFRDSPTYGTANIVNKKFDQNPWNQSTGALTAPDGETWSGSGWVGQPLMMTWPKELRQKMNMHDWAKDADTLTEVVYATMDGNIYFLDLQTGRQTRDPLTLGYTFKGAGALDPRGYPILYVGSGYDSYKGKSHVFIINLLDCSVMYEFGSNDSFSLRGNLSFFDGSPLVDAETDRLIYPGESGILYIMRLNTNYDPEAGTLSISPSDIVKWRYKGLGRTAFYSGMEDSAVIWRGHIFITTNDGYLFCLNINTLETVWVQDVLDDTNCTPVLELEDGHPYIYISTSFRYGIRSSSTAPIPIWKIDAVTGEILWHVDYNCYSTSGTSGGVQGTLAVGKNKLSDLIFVPVARTPSINSGVLVAINKQTGTIVWEQETQMYVWSSPVAVYDEEGNGYVILCTTGGTMYLFDGLTGEMLDFIDLGSNIEASPAVYENTVVVGTRATGIYGVKLT